ncbi:MAG: YhgE/Pip domain-containing protein [Pseudobutyrivibrio sp.]|nr:YhgE/Pip domain-containing protein [Pseudobutyrivibrio sp.]
MKMVRRIFFDDCKSLIKNFFALVIVIGICFLPALYAWFNIYSNWDPYGNTAGLKLAAVSVDEGCVYEGEYKNQGDVIINNLKDNKSVDWHFVSTKEEAIAGVEDGTYYAAVVIDEKFSYNIYNIFMSDATTPTLYFYQNQKKNAVANKITDTVVSTIQNNINEAFIEVITSMLFVEASDLYGTIEEEGGVTTIVDKLQEINNELETYKKTIGSVEKANASMANALAVADVDVKKLNNDITNSAKSLTDTNAQLASTQEVINAYHVQVDAILTDVQARLDRMEETVIATDIEQDAAAMTKYITSYSADTTVLLTEYYALLEAEKAYQTAAPGGTIDDQTKQQLEEQLMQITGKDLEQSIELLNGTLGILSKNFGDAAADKIVSSDYELLKSTIDTSKQTIASLQEELNSNIIPNMNNVIDKMEVVLTDTSKAMTDISKTLTKMGNVFTALDATLESSNTSLEKTSEAISAINKKLSDIIDKVETATESEKLEVLVNTLAGDPDAYGEFFAEPVTIEANAIYPIENYGSAVAPFYTTLAIWVGSIILTAIIKVKPDANKYKDATRTQMFFGRYLLYWILSIIQAIVIVSGDLSIFNVQCVEPGWFLFASCVTATVFSLFIYSLVVTFGDVGKAAVVVIVVLQIAGSSGTYPIELLPEFFQHVYIFFPFPYAINSMRECICGMYEMDYWLYLAQLCTFIIAALFIGLVLRIPFEELNHYMEERMEETEMM